MDNDPSHKEFFDMGLPLREYGDEHKTYPIVEDNPMPKEAKYRSIINRYTKWWHFQNNVCLDLIRLIAVGLGKKSDYFDQWFKKDSLGTFRTIHYLPRD